MIEGGFFTLLRIKIALDEKNSVQNSLKLGKIRVRYSKGGEDGSFNEKDSKLFDTH